MGAFSKNFALTEEQPAFYHSYEYVQGQRLGVIKLNQEVAAHMANEWTIDTVHPRHLPMLVKPKPWLNYNDGGYLYHKSTLLVFFNTNTEHVLTCI